MVPHCTTAEDLLKAITDEKVQMIDLRFTDLPGVCVPKTLSGLVERRIG
jgi:glutamine synthetase